MGDEKAVEFLQDQVREPWAPQRELATYVLQRSAEVLLTSWSPCFSATVLAEYDQHARITEGDPEQMTDAAAAAFVAFTTTGTDA